MSKRRKPTWGQTRTIIAALDYLGSHRKTRVIPGNKSCPVSKITANRLVMKRWAMWNDKYLMLTWEGERRWSMRHPYSKYSVVKAKNRWW